MARRGHQGMSEDRGPAPQGPPDVVDDANGRGARLRPGLGLLLASGDLHPLFFGQLFIAVLVHAGESLCRTFGFLLGHARLSELLAIHKGVAVAIQVREALLALRRGVASSPIAVSRCRVCSRKISPSTPATLNTTTLSS